MRLCCFFNYPPLYRESIYKKIDEEFDCQFYFGKEVEGQKNSGIKKLDFSIFKKPPKEFDNVVLAKGSVLWRRTLLRLAFSKYDTFLLTGDWCLTYIPFLLLTKLFRKRVFFWGHGEKHNSRKAWKLEKWMYRLMDGYFTYGEGGKKRLIELGIPENKLHVIYNSLIDKTNAEKNLHLQSDIYKLHFGNDLPVVLFVGRLTPQKKLHQLLEVAHTHRSQGTEYNIIFIGDGPERHNLEKIAHDKGLSNNIWFYGECYEGEDLNRLIYNADVCVSPGNVGLTALHAMQFGLPVISHDDFETQMPEYETIIPDKTGMLFKRGSMDDLSDKISYWLANHCNSEKRANVRKNCYEVIDGYFNSNYQINLLNKVLNSSDK